MGDLFDAWLGDEQCADPFGRGIVAAMRGITDAGVPVYVARGNRDFLLGDAFTAATGATLLPEQTLVDLGGTNTLLTHGDEFCTDDVDYQRYRRLMRDPRHQRRLLRLPYFIRRWIAKWLRRKSRAATARKPESILDVNAGAIDAAFRRFGVARMIHGHTHRPARHTSLVDGVERERVVLADWDDRGHYLEVDERGARTREITG
jgi:UDP-2,3-diacylglucosamine hydrolase